MAMQVVQESVSTAKSYAPVLLDFAMKYGGGKDLPFLRFVDDMQKHNDSGNRLGNSFWHTIYAMKFYSDSKVQQKLTATRPLMRLSLMCLQSCMPDHRDHIASFVTDTDLNKIKAKAAAKVVDEIETLLEEAIAFTAVLEPDMWNVRHIQKPLANLMMRCTLKALDKEKSG